MAKLTKAQARAHREACEILQKDVLSEDDKEFVFTNWQESATHVNSAAGAFFTPYNMAFDFALDVGGKRIIDLCAGIGMLSYAVWHRSAFDSERPQITCVERNPDYIAVGKKLLPEATWIEADVLGVLGIGLGKFDWAISNPPFGRIKGEGSAPRYGGAEFEFHVIDIASHLARYGTFIVPQMSAGFNYSGRQSYERQTSGKAVDFQRLTGLHFDCGVGVDTAFHQDDWKGVSPLCEIVCVDFAPVPAPANDNQPVAAPASPSPAQADLFGEAA